MPVLRELLAGAYLASRLGFAPNDAISAGMIGAYVTGYAVAPAASFVRSLRSLTQSSGRWRAFHIANVFYNYSGKLRVFKSLTPLHTVKIPDFSKKFQSF